MHLQTRIPCQVAKHDLIWKGDSSQLIARVLLVDDLQLAVRRGGVRGHQDLGRVPETNHHAKSVTAPE